jgi:hypothetical protein
MTVRLVCLSRSASGPWMARRRITSLGRDQDTRRAVPLTWDFWLERVTGIEPALSAWEADVLPLNYTRVPPQPA